MFNFLVKVIGYNRNKLIYSSQKLNWDPLIIFRLGCKPEALHICKILTENVDHHVPKKCKHVDISENRFVGARLFLEKSIPYATSGHAHKWKMIVHWSSLYQVVIKKFTFTIKMIFILFLWSQTKFFMRRHFFIWSHLRCVSKGFIIITTTTTNYSPI